MQDIFNRTERLVGERVMDAFSNVSVILFGVGGVGSWCAEGLVRSGIRKLTIVIYLNRGLIQVLNINTIVGKVIANAIVNCLRNFIKSRITLPK